MQPMNLNVFSQMSDLERRQVGEWLHTTYQEIVDEGNVNEDLATGLEKVLEGLGMPGYEFT